MKIYALRWPMPGVSDRSLIRLGALARLATRLLLLFASGLRSMQLMQVRSSLERHTCRGDLLRCASGRGRLLVLLPQGGLRGPAPHGASAGGVPTGAHPGRLHGGSALAFGRYSHAAPAPRGHRFRAPRAFLPLKNDFGSRFSGQKSLEGLQLDLKSDHPIYY